MSGDMLFAQTKSAKTRPSCQAIGFAKGGRR
jgi:hypothetical protein